MKKLAFVAAALVGLVASGAQAQTASGNYNGHTYQYYSTALNFAAANSAAAGLGGYLATVTSQGEQDFIHTLTSSATAYIGGSDAVSEGTWRWLGGPEAGQSFFSTSGAPVDLAYSFWNNGEPNDFGGEDALLINWNSGTGQWNDINGGNAYGYVVEIGGRATGAVPEPATWAMMIGGFGLIGGTMRRRRTTAAFATA